MKINALKPGTSSMWLPPKLLLIMKLISFIMFAAIMQVSAIGYSQINLNKKNIRLDQALESIKEQTGYVFLSKDYDLTAVKITLNLKNIGIEEALDACFKGLPLSYKIVRKTIFIQPDRASSNKLGNVIQGLFQNNIDVSGRVVDEEGLPLSGANVKVKGTKQGTRTDEKGQFYLKDINENAVLEISFLGHKTKEIKAARDLGDVILEISAGDLNEVNVTVSTGYQTLPKERVTGSFSSISAKTLQQQRLSSMQSLLEGRIPGYNNGLIRGTTSMNGVNYPLYVIDGFPVEDNSVYGQTPDGIPGLNLEDIESITVLKDAAAASIYGARAANGVIVIVTKKAKKGKPQVSVSSTFTLSPYHQYTDNLTNSADIIELEKEWAANNPNLNGAGAAAYAANLLENNAYPSQGISTILRNYTGALSQADLTAKLNSLASSGYQYYDDVAKYSKRNPFYQQYNINVGNKTEKNSFYSSVTYHNNKTEDKYAGDEMVGFNLNNTTQINNWLSMELSTYFSYNEVTTQPYNTLSPQYNYLPYDRLVNADGSNFTNTAASRYPANTMAIIDSYGLYNLDITPLEEQAMNLGKSKNFNSRSFIKLNAKITNWLSYQPSFQYEYSTNRLNQLYGENSYYVRNMVNNFASPNPDGTATFNLPYGNINYNQTQFSNSYNFRQQLNIDKRFGDKHTLTAILGSEIRNSRKNYSDQYLYNYDPMALSHSPVDETLLSAFGGGLLDYANFNSNTQSEPVNRFVSLYANAGYTYEDKYLFNGSIRWDRSNLWVTSSKYQKTPIWSLGAGWNIYKESFFDVDWVNLLKFRVSHGIAGNIAPDNAPYMTARYSPNYNVGGLQATISSRPNPLLSWEKTTTTNAGVDFAMFKNRLSGSVDYYHKQGKDLLANTMGVPTEGFGYSTYQINNGEMLNQGVEFVLSGDIVRNKDLNWNVGVQYAFNKNKVTYVNVEAPVYYLQLDYPEAYPKIGNAYNAIYSYKWAGLSSTGLPQVYNENGEKVTSSPTTLESITYSGSTVPKYSGSFNSSLEYKNFTFSFLLTFEGGHKMRNTFLPVLNSPYNSSLGYYATQISIVNKDIVNRWKKPGDEAFTNIPRVVFGEDPDFNSDSYTLYSDADINVLDASNARLRNISLAYTLPKTLSKKAGLESIRFQFNVENAFTIAASKTAKYLLDGYRSPNYVWGVYLNF